MLLEQKMNWVPSDSSRAWWERVAVSTDLTNTAIQNLGQPTGTQFGSDNKMSNYDAEVPSPGHHHLLLTSSSNDGVLSPEPFLHQFIYLRDQPLQVDGGKLAVFDDEPAVDEDELGAGGMAEQERAERVLGGGTGELDGVEVVDRKSVV